MGTLTSSGPLAIELGDLSLTSATSITEIAWLLGSLVLLASLSLAILWWSRRSRPDPFL